MNKTVRNLLISGILITSIATPVWASTKGNDADLIIKKNIINYEMTTKTANINMFETLQANKVYKHMNMINRTKIGKEMIIKLYENPSTGYLWNVKIDNPELLSYEEKLVESEIPEEDGKIAICGEGSHKLYTFKALKKGTTKVTFELKRDFEAGSEPIEVREYIIEVR
ncbi:protease inhibitor I42 family protein [Anaeromicrobium sediminis]|uniref:Proteinase inhibitor I42 chagasin domain-containing protein n=1 Tax=Anaeromicrobium sediminis TaxID=1478221 RepID=A0A267ME94_9FIRM|nr:protease inhibitor I42 family protein [Anaeromicrobium sediminis]PAB57113.1 hypothetical protein CCE28_19475 [Anaeromicrobium sediminis]